MAHEQVRRGTPGQALLRRLRVRGRRGERSPSERALAPVPGRGPRQRPAALRRAGQHGRLLRGPQAGRPDPGHEPGPRRPPHPRHRRSTSAAACTRSTRTASTARPSASTTTRSRRRPARSGPKVIVAGATRLSPHHRLRAAWPRSPTASARCCSSTWPTSPGSWRPGSTRARSRTPTSSRRRPTRRSAARAAGSIFSRADLPDGVDRADFPMVKTTLARGDRPERLPGHPGRAADARDRGQGRRVPARHDRRLPATTRPHDRERRGPRRDARGRRRAADLAAARTTTSMLVDVTPLGVTGREAEALLDEVGITVNKNAIPSTRTRRTRDRDPDRDARHHDPRLRARRDARDRADDRRRRSARATSRPSRPASRPRSREIVARFPVPGLPTHESTDRRCGRDPALRLRSLPAPRRGVRGRAVLALVLTPLVRRLAHPRSEIVDRPDHRRVNLAPVPRGGGIAVAAAFLAGRVGAIVVNDGLQIVNRCPSTIGPPELARACSSAARSRRSSASSTTTSSSGRAGSSSASSRSRCSRSAPGSRVTSSTTRSGPGTIVLEGPFAAGFTVVWIIGMINSINFIDGLDGLSTGIALIAAVTLGLISLTATSASRSSRCCASCWPARCSGSCAGTSTRRRSSSARAA